MPLSGVEPRDYILRYHNDDIALNGTFVVLFENDPVTNNTEIPKYLSALSYSVVFPQITLDTYSYATKYKNQIIIPSSLTVSQQFTLRLYDTSEGLVNQYLQKWILACRDNFSRFIPNNLNVNTPKKVKTNIAIVTTDESFSQIYQTVIFAGCIPTSMPLTALNSDIVSRQVISFDVSFSFDFMILGTSQQVNDYIKTIQDDLKSLHQQILKDYETTNNKTKG